MEIRKLGPRLEAVARFIPYGSRVADVGTDHGLLPIWLRIRGISPFVIASDIHPGPLNSARRNAEKYGVSGISFRLCPGLRDILQSEVDAVVLAGMSGETICSILQDAGWDWERKHLILEANTKQPELLTWLYQNGLHLEGEQLIAEKDRYYRVFRIAYGAEIMPRAAYLWGGLTPGPFAIRQAKLLLHALSGLQRSADPRDLARLAEYREILEDMKDAYHWNDLECLI